MLFVSKKFSAVILAGGASVRMGAPKLHMILCGMPVVARTLRTFEECSDCSEIIVVAKEEEAGLYENYIRLYGFKKIKAVVNGGKTRQESAFIGLNAISREAEYIAIHDADRCLVTDEIIKEVFREAKKHRVATAACKTTDTVKISDGHGKTLVKDQPERAKVYAVQTPQIFLADLYKAAAYSALREGYTGTDDCALSEHAGFAAKLVDCGKRNMKITEPIDMLLAETILKAEGRDRK